MNTSDSGLEARQLHFARNTRALFANLSFSVQAGEMLQITGANGTGKTSLIKILCGLIQPDGGTVLWGQHNISDFAEDYRSDLAFIGHKDGIKGDLTPQENLAFSAAMADTNVTPAAALAHWGLADVHTPCRLLSAGQRRRTALARLALGRARLWLLDEPLTALDEDGWHLLGNMARTHLETGGVIVMSTHRSPDWDLPAQRKVTLNAAT